MVDLGAIMTIFVEVESENAETAQIMWPSRDPNAFSFQPILTKIGRGGSRDYHRGTL